MQNSSQPAGQDSEQNTQPENKPDALLDELNADSLNLQQSNTLNSLLAEMLAEGVTPITTNAVLKRLSKSNRLLEKDLHAHYMTLPHHHETMMAQRRQAKVEARNWLLGFVAFILIGTLALLWKLDKLPHWLSQPMSSGQVVFINPQLLAENITVQVMKKQLTPEQTLLLNGQIHQKVINILQGYVNRGTSVLYNNVAYAVNPELDITNDVISQLGYKPINPDEYKRNYTDVQKYDVFKNFAQNNVGEIRDQIIAEQQQAETQAAINNLDQQSIIQSNGESIDLQ